MELTRQEIQKEPKEEPVRLASTDQAVAIRPVHLRDLIPFKHDEFEYFVGAVIEAAGVACDLKRVGGANDQGADLLGKDQFTRPFIVQCKRYFGHPVTPTEMRDLLGARSSIYHADIAWFVTTSTFSRGAERAAAQIRRTGKVVLIDGETLIGLIHTCWEKLPIQWQRRLIQIILASE